ncbi:membrane protein [gut metagenome]|uniref:Membrane protein n=1 Tax=gut metagenome TaxID=749906 RepID=J9GDQ0_9ZZZZ
MYSLMSVLFLGICLRCLCYFIHFSSHCLFFWVLPCAEPLLIDLFLYDYKLPYELFIPAFLSAAHGCSGYISSSLAVD